MQEYEALNLIEEERSWQDVRYDEDGNVTTDNFPYPPKFVRSEAQGELAERIRAAFAEGDAEIKEKLNYEPVYLTEKTVFGGYSEYTQENMMYLRVSCSYFDKGFAPSYGSFSLIDALLEWLDTAEKPEGFTAVEETDEEEEDTYGW